MIKIRKRGTGRAEKARSGGIVSEGALYQSEEMFRTLAEMSSAVIFVYQGEKIIYANKAAERITGFTNDELLRKKFWEYAHPEFHDLLRERGLARQRGEPVPSHYEVKFVTKGGETRWADLTAGRIELNGKPAGIATYIDITERKLAEEAFRQVNRVIESCPVVIFRWKASEGWPIILVSGNVELFGYSPEEFRSGVIPYASVIYPGDLERVMAEVKEHSASGTDQFRQEYRVVTRDGRVRWVDDRTVIERDAAGKITHYQGIIIDITGQKQAEEALRESEERLRLCIATARLGSYDSDVVNDRHVWSPETYEIYGIPRGTAITLDYITGLVVPEDRRDSQYFAELDPATSHDEFVMEYRIRRPSDGAIRWVNTRTRVFFNGEGTERRAVRVLGVVKDVTERKQAEENLRLTQFAVDNFTDSSLWQNSDGRIIYVNEVACENLGYSRNELLSMKVWDIDRNCSHDKFHRRWELLKKNGSIKFESVHFRKDGSSYPVEVSANYLEFEGREYQVTFDRDITKRKARENDLSDTKAQAELYLDLMGHDINNLNQVALGYLELAGDAIRSGRKLGQESIVLIDKPIASLNSSSKLIDKVMKLKRLKARGPGHYTVDISRVLARAKDRYSHQAGRDITINYDPPAECLVMADELVDEIFLNLVDNSIKHSHKDRPLAIDIIQTMVGEDGGKCVSISVEDNGPGISDEVKEKLFERFSRGETQARGKGLGLYLVKTLVEDFHGKIWVEDRVRGDHTQGVKFVVVLPVVEKLSG